MRISTGMMYDTAVSSMNRQQADLLKTQQHLATGRRVLTAADDPVAAARAIEIRQALASNQQFAENRHLAMSKLGMVEGALGSLTTVIQNVRTITTSAANAAMSDRDRASLAVELRSYLQELVGLANMRDESGQYLFGGFRVATQPFAPAAAGGVAYAGDDGVRTMQVSDSRQIAIAAPGSNIFERIRDGNGVFAAVARGTNAGAGVVSAGSVIDAGALTNDRYTIAFQNSGGAITYSVTNTTTGAVVSSGTPYQSGSAIAFGGMQVEIAGEPADGDAFDLAPSSSRSVFSTVEQLIELFSQPRSSAALTNGINAALQNLDQALDSALAARAAVGGSLKELDALHTAGEALHAQHQQTLSRLQDIDYAEAISQLTQQQLYYEAAQRSFVRISGLSLFNYL